MSNGREAGWYPDPAGKYELRWFDGEGWTDQISEGGTTAADPFFRPGALPPEPAAAVARSRRPLVLAGIAVVVAVVAVAVAVLALGGDDPDSSSTVALEEGTTTTEATTTTTEATTTTTTLDDPSEVVGSTLASAVAELTRAGFEVDEVEVIDTSVPDGQVLAAEERPDGTVVLTVARPPVTRFLETYGGLVRNDGNVDGPTFDVSGTTYTHGVTINTCSSPRVYEYDLGRDFRRFQATAGLVDDVPSETRVRLELSLDGVIVTTNDLAFGEVVDIDLDVTNALRLRATLTELSVTSFCPFFGLGDGRLLGVPSEVPEEPGG